MKGFNVLKLTDGERIAQHSCLELAERYMALLVEEFPRRKFELRMIGRVLAIQTVGAYANVRFHGPRSVSVCMCELVYNTTQSKVQDHMGKAFEQETKLRKTQSHQRQQINKWLARLQETEMLDSPHLVMSMNEWTDDVKHTPVATWHWAGLPDDPVISVRFSLYSNKWSGDRNFKVRFGNDYDQPFDTIGDLESYFNGSDVFKENDRYVGKEHFQFLTPTATEAEISWPKQEDPYVIIPRNYLVRVTPHLLLMEASNPEILQARVKPTVWYAQERIQAAMQTFAGPTVTVDYVKFPCHPELQWDFHYANGELESQFGEDI